MAKIKLKELELVNVASWRHLKFNFSEHKRTLIIGKVGAGKSNIGAGAFWVITGEFLHARSADEVINEQIGKNTSGRLSFEIGDDKYQISRYRKHSGWKNKVVLKKNGIRFGEKDSKISYINNEIQRLLGPPEELRRIFIISRRSIPFPALTDTAQKKEFERLTELRQIPDAEKIVKARLSRTKTTLVILKERLSQQEEAIKTARGLVSQQHSQVSKQEKIIKASIKSAKIHLIEAEAHVTSFTKDLHTVEKITQKFSKEITALEAMNSVLKEEIDTKEHRVVKLEKQKPGSRCDRCNSIMTEEGIKESIESLKAEIEKIKIERLENKKKIESINQQITQEGDIIKLSKGLKEAEKQAEKWNAYLESKKEELVSDTPQTLPIKETLVKLKAQRYRTLMWISIIRRLKNRFIVLLEKFGRKGPLRTSSLPIILTDFEAKSNLYFSALGIVQVRYTLEKGSIIQKYCTGHSDKWRTYGSLSDGETTLANRCADFALRDVAESSRESLIDTVFLDEPFDGLDSEHMERVPAVLDILKDKNIIVISHSSELKPYFSDIITVQNIKGISSFA